MAEANLTVFLTGKGTQLINEFKKVSKASGDSADKTSSTWGKVGKGVAAAGGLIAGSALAVGTESIHMADKFEEAHTRLVGAIQSTGGSFDKLKGPVGKVDSQLEHLGFTNTDTESSLSVLTRASGSTHKALGLMGLAANIARGRNIDLGTATGILAKVQTGHVALLGRLGIKTKDATGHTISQHAAMKKLAAMFKDQASLSADTFAGKQKILGAQLEDVGVKIGVAVIPLLEKLADFLVTKVIPAIDSTVAWVEKNWPKVQKVIVTTVRDIRNVVVPILHAIEAFWKAWGGRITSFVKGTFGAIATFIGGAMQIIRGVIQVFTSLIHGDWSGAWNGIKKIVSGAWEAISGIVKLAMTVVTTTISAGWQIIKGRVKQGIGAVVGFFRALPGEIIGIFANAGDWLYDIGKRIIDGLLNGIKDALGSVKDFLGSVGSKIISWKGPPAKDAKLLIPTGQVIMKGLADGIGRGMPDIRTKLGEVTNEFGQIHGTAIRVPKLDLGAKQRQESGLPSEWLRAVAIAAKDKLQRERRQQHARKLEIAHLAPPVLHEELGQAKKAADRKQFMDAFEGKKVAPRPRVAGPSSDFANIGGGGGVTTINVYAQGTEDFHRKVIKILQEETRKNGSIPRVRVASN